MGLRIFSNGIHCRTVMSLYVVSLRPYEMRTPSTYKLERKTENASANPRYTKPRNVWPTESRK